MPEQANPTVTLDVPMGENVALYCGAGLKAALPLKRWQVRGGDRMRWLSGMVTNTVNDLASGEGALNLVLNAQGRIQGELNVWRGAADEIELDIEDAQAEKLITHLDKFIIMDDVELVAVEGVEAVGVYGPDAEKVLAALGVSAPSEAMRQSTAVWSGIEILIRRGYGPVVPRFELWCAVEKMDALCAALKSAGAIEVGDAAVEVLRIVEGVPRYGVDIAEKDLPQESSLTRALHFNKGCYLGQEIVERIRSRGNVHRHLRQLEFVGDVPVVGSEVMLKDAVAGSVTSVARVGKRVFGLAMLKAEAELPDALLSYAGGSVRVLQTPPSEKEIEKEIQ